jgi:pSer/pThr/pTyr-binding forkhead associated (FHA) protein
MAKLYLVFENTQLKEFTITQSGMATIGRLPDNLIHIDNLAVSGHHARIFYDGDHYVIEDHGSTNGTFVNKQRITGKVDLNDGDEVTIGKHTVRFKDEWHEDDASPKTAQITGPAVPKLEATVMLDTKKAKEMMAAAAAAKAGAAPPAAASPATPGAPAAPRTTSVPPAAPPPAAERVGVLTVLAGKTDQQQYRLTSKLTVIGKSDMASIKLHGWFAPKVGATITKRDQKYFISQGDKKVIVDGQQITGQKELSEGSTIDVSGLKMSFDYE